MIVPISIQFGKKFEKLRQGILREGAVWVSAYSRRPSTLWAWA